MIYGTPENQCTRCLELAVEAPLLFLQDLCKRWYIYDPYFDVEKGERRALHNSYGEDQEEDEADLFSDD